MRDLIEKVLAHFPHGSGWDLELNPTRNEYIKLVQDATTQWSGSTEPPLRGLLDLTTQDIYLWDAHYAAHGAIIDRLGLKGAAHLFIDDVDKRVTVLTLWRYERLGYTREDIDELVQGNPVLNRILPGFSIVIED